MQTVENPIKTRTGNTLYPIFVKFEQMEVLVVGGGNVGLEKITSVLRNSPQTHLTLVATYIFPEVRAFAKDYPNVKLIEKPFEPSDLDGKRIVILATNDRELNHSIKKLAEARNILANVADTPDLCDFYLGSIVQKGDLKIAISSNGKSPTMTKRIKETLNEVLPDEIDDLLQNMRAIRDHLRGNFAYKVKKLNEVTRDLAVKPQRVTINWPLIAILALIAFAFSFIFNLLSFL